MDAHWKFPAQVGKKNPDIKQYLKDNAEVYEVNSKAARWAAWILGKELFPHLKWKELFRQSPQKYYALRLGFQEPRRFLVDSGASFRLMSYKVLTKEEKRTIRPSGMMRERQTANGIVESKFEVDVYSKDLGQKVTALLLPDVCPVVSLGKLAKEGNWLYIWRPDSPPYLKSIKDGRIVSCSIEHDTSIILSGKEISHSDSSQGTVAEEDAIEEESFPIVLGSTPDGSSESPPNSSTTDPEVID